jgi:hypothetical protein
MEDLLNQLCTAIASEFSERSSPGRKIWQMIRSLRPVITYDGLSGAPLVSVRSTPEESRKSIADLLSVLEGRRRQDPQGAGVCFFRIPGNVDQAPMGPVENRSKRWPGVSTHLSRFHFRACTRESGYPAPFPESPSADGPGVPGKRSGRKVFP